MRVSESASSVCLGEGDEKEVDEEEEEQGVKEEAKSRSIRAVIGGREDEGEKDTQIFSLKKKNAKFEK